MVITERLVKAFKVGAPLIAVETADPAATLLAARDAFEALEIANGKVGLVMWDCAAGARPINETGKAAVAKLGGKPEALVAPAQVLIKAMSDLPDNTVLFMQNMHRFLGNDMVLQAVWNLRDKFKANGRMLVMLGTTFRMPAELQHDVFTFVEPLPSRAQLGQTIGELRESGIELSDDTIEKAANAAIGVTAFAAENLAAMACTKEGMNLTQLWDSKRRKINETPGLKVANALSFGDLGGLSQVKKFMGGILRGNDAPSAIVFIDEADKAMAGAQHDTSGVSQDQLGSTLTWMEDKEATGIIAYGVPGSGKSALAKACGAEIDIPVIELDLGGLKGSLVGQSQQQLREALKVIDAVSAGRTLFIATCNSLVTLPPEFRRRFKLGTWFFDLPDMQERIAIWKLYAARYEFLPATYSKLLSREWTGAEIKTCCEIAWRMNTTLVDAAQYIVPVAVAAREQLDGLRRGAANRFLSASKPGLYDLGEDDAGSTRRFLGE